MEELRHTSSVNLEDAMRNLAQEDQYTIHNFLSTLIEPSGRRLNHDRRKCAVGEQFEEKAGKCVST